MQIDKSDFIAFLTEFGSTILTEGSSFKGFFVPLQASKQLPDVKLEPGDAVVYTDPAKSIVLGELLTFGGKSFVLVSNSKIQYINGNPIYLELGLARFMPGLTVPGEYQIRTSLAFSLSSAYDILEGLYGLLVPASYDIPVPVSASLQLSSAYNIAEHLFALLVPASYDIALPAAASLLLSARYDIAEGRYTPSVPASYDIAEQLFSLAVPASYDIPLPITASLLLSSAYDIAGNLFTVSIASSYDIAGNRFGLAIAASYTIPAPVPASLLLSTAYDIAQSLAALSVPAAYDILAPTAISGLRAEFIAPSAIVLHWNAHEPSEVDHYEVHRSTSPSFSPSAATLVGRPATNSFRNRDLLEDVIYYFKVCTVDRKGNKGSFSTEISATTSGS
jgi:hypothetical protein